MSTFEYIVGILSIVLGLALANLLPTIVESGPHPQQRDQYALPLIGMFTSNRRAHAAIVVLWSASYAIQETLQSAVGQPWNCRFSPNVDKVDALINGRSLYE